MLTLGLLRVAVADGGLRAIAGLAVAVLAIALFVRPGAIGGPLGGVVVPWPLLSCVLPLALVSAWRTPTSALERSSARGPLVPAFIRLAAAGAIVVLVTLVVAAAAPVDGAPVSGHGLTAWRNAALVSGLALAGGALLSPTYAWVGATTYVLACVAAGVPDGREPYAWTLVLQPPEDSAALVTAVLALALGLACGFWSLRRPAIR